MESLDSKGAPPPYESHEKDTVYDPTELPTDVPQPTQPESTPLNLPEDLLLSAGNILSSGPLSLTLDRDLIYPTEPPSRAFYHLPRSLECHGDKVFLERSVPATAREDGSHRKKAKDQELYHIVGSRIASREIEIRGMRKSCYGDSIGRMRPRSQLRRTRWDVTFRKQTVLRYRSRTWTGAEGKIVATEQKRTSKPVIVIEQGIDMQMVDLLVACWCAKTWWDWDGKYRDGGSDTKPWNPKRISWV